MGIRSSFAIKRCCALLIFFAFFSLLFSQSEAHLKSEEDKATQEGMQDLDKDVVKTKDSESLILNKKKRKEKSNYTFDILEDGQLKFTQILEWPSFFGVLYYELTVREKESGNVVVDKLRSEVAKAELTLAPGFYEYKVDAYNMLSHLASSSEWANIEVKKAHRPAIESLRPGTIWIEDEKWDLNVHGKDFVEDAEIALVSDGILKRTIRLAPIKRTDKSLYFHFKNPEMFLGTPYRVWVRDPSGVESVSGQFFVKYRRPVSFYVGLGYAPISPVSDSFYKSHWNSPIYLASFTGTIGLIFSRQSYGYFGVSSKSTARFINLKEDDVTLKNRVFINTFNLVYEWWFIKKLSLYISPGFGVAVNKLQFIYEDGIDNGVNFVDPAYGISLGLRAKVHRFLYLDVLLRVEQILNKDVKPVFITPEVSFGFRY